MPRWEKTRVYETGTRKGQPAFIVELYRDEFLDNRIELAVWPDWSADKKVTWSAELILWAMGREGYEGHPVELPGAWDDPNEAKALGLREAQLFLERMLEKLRSARPRPAKKYRAAPGTELIRGEYGPVVIVRGKLAGRFADYDDDEHDGAVVYMAPDGIVGSVLRNEGYYILPWSWLRTFDPRSALNWLQAHAATGEPGPVLVR